MKKKVNSLRWPLIYLALWHSCYLQASLPEPTLKENHHLLLETYCYEPRFTTEKGEVDLEALSFNTQHSQTADLWQKVLNVLNSGEMLPDDEPQIPNAGKTSLLDDLSNKLA